MCKALPKGMTADPYAISQGMYPSTNVAPLQPVYSERMNS